MLAGDLRELPTDPGQLQIADRAARRCRTCEVDSSTPVSRERVPIGEQGELRTRGSMVMNGYWEEPEATARGDRRRTASSARATSRDGRERLRSITGRAKEMIIRGGENIYPAEIENAIRELEAVADVAVIGVPDERYGESLAAYVRPAEGAALTYEELREQLQGRVARYKIPAHLRLMETCR